ncbi:hypothetical protein [Ferruginibacter sp.]
MSAIDHTVVHELNHSFALQLPDRVSFEEAQALLAAHIDHLIKNNFEALVSLLYKIDIDEAKLRSHLAGKAGDDTGNVIALLIIERLLQKQNFKKQFSAKPSADDNEEKW